MNNTCPNCGKQYQIGPQNVGATFPCRGCGKELTVDAQGIQLVGGVQSSRASAQPVENPPQGPQFFAHSPRTRPGPRTSAIEDFLQFRRMITPWVIKILFLLTVLLSIFFGIILILMGLTTPPAPGQPFYAGPVGGLCGGLMIMVLGPFIVRIYAELFIVIFRINETLTDIYNLQKSRQ